MDATPNPSPAPTPADAAVDALALVRRIRDDFAARTAGLEPEALIALIAREAAPLAPEATQAAHGRSAA